MSQPQAILPPTPTPGDTYQCPDTSLVVIRGTAYSVWRPEILLNISGVQDSPTAKQEGWALGVNSVEDLTVVQPHTGPIIQT